MLSALHGLTLCPQGYIFFNFHQPEVVSRYRDPQLQVSENYLYLLARCLLFNSKRWAMAIEVRRPRRHRR